MTISILKKLDRNHFDEMMKLEKKYYSEEYIAPAEEAYEWYKAFPNSTVAATDGNRIIGFVNLFPVKKEIFEEIKAGTFNDQYLSVNDIESLESSELHMFLSCIVVKYEYRKLGLTKELLQKAVMQYIDVESRTQEIVIDTVTEDGARFSEKYGFSFIRNSDHGTKIYAQSYNTFIQRIY